MKDEQDNLTAGAAQLDFSDLGGIDCVLLGASKAQTFRMSDNPCVANS